MPKTIHNQALTFDDVLLLPQKSDILPQDTNTSTWLTKNIRLNIPLLSADMDTVTESCLAVAIAREGGIGIIHKNMTPDEQAKEVEIVKRSESGVITDPITLSPDVPIENALDIMASHHISGIPVTQGGKLVGILTHRDIRFETNLRRRVKELMTKKLITAPQGITVEKAKQILHQYRIEKLPLVDKKGNLRGLITVKDIQKMTEYPRASKDRQGRLRVGASVGVGKDALERVKKTLKAGVDVIVVGTAHGHSTNVIEKVKEIKKRYPGLDIIAGNVVTGKGARDLIRAGADAIKVGIGPGSICITRVVAGIGMPQITAILGCVEAAKKQKIPVVADGGIRYSGDITKALAAGANAVMIGNIFAGTEESPGELVYWKGKRYKAYRGMGSLGALRKGSQDRYSQDSSAKIVPEGVEGRVMYKGSVHNVVEQLIGGLKAGMGYCGVKNLDALQKHSVFIPVSKASVVESHPHNIVVTEEAPNYSRQ